MISSVTVRRRYLLLALALLLVAGAAFVYTRRPRVVTTQPRTLQVVESVAASGQVAGQTESDVGPEVAGRLASVLVQEGQRVRSGQVLARLDQTLLQKQVDQALAALQTAEAQLEQAARRPLASEVERARAEVQQQIGTAQAQLDSSQDRLRELRRGPTREELLQAQGQARQAQAQLAQAQREDARQQTLLAQGAIAGQEAERARTSFLVARNAAVTAEARLKQLQVGTRVEVIEQAQAQVEQARASLQGAEQAGAARLQGLADQPRVEDVLVARRRRDEAREALAVARERLRQASVTAPYSGQVTRVLLKAGQLTGASAPVVHMVRLPGLEIHVPVDETNLDRLKVGQRAVISSDAYPDTFDATLREISPQVLTERGTVELKLTPVKPPAWLRPGLTVSVNVIVAAARPLPVVPLTSVTREGKASSVLVVEGSTLKRQEIQVGPAGRDGFPVTGGLTGSEQVVVSPDGLKPGQKVR